MAISPSSVVFDDANGNSVVVTAVNPLPIGGGVASGATDAGNPVKVAGVFNTVRPLLTTGQRGDMQLDTRGNLAVGLYSANSGNPIVTNIPGDAQSNAQFMLLVSAFPEIFNGSTWDREVKTNATARLLSSAATTNATSVKGSAGNVCKIFGNNTVAVKKYLKLYNKATAPTVGTDTPVLTFVIPVSAAFTFDLTSYGHYFSVGIAYAITGAAADADTTAIGAGDIECLNITYA